MLLVVQLYIIVHVFPQEVFFASTGRHLHICIYIAHIYIYIFVQRHTDLNNLCRLLLLCFRLNKAIPLRSSAVDRGLEPDRSRTAPPFFPAYVGVGVEGLTRPPMVRVRPVHQVGQAFGSPCLDPFACNSRS